MAYTVVRGDTLGAIARKLGVSVAALHEANRGVIGANPNLIRPGQVLQMPGAAGGGEAASTDLQKALDSYGFVGQLANAIPELKAILEQAAREEWAPEKFDRAVMDSDWWKQSADSVRQLAILEATDPSTYQQNLTNAADKVRLMAQQMGRPGSPEQRSALALQALTNNWDDEQIRAQIGAQLPLEVIDDAWVGDAAQMEQHLRRTIENYGVSYTDDWLRTALDAIQRGDETLGGWEGVVRARAKATYAQFASQIDAGMTVRDIADPYIATMAQTLELPETGIKLTDATIQKALTTRGADGVAGTQPLWEFQRALRDDPRWDKTNNARASAASLVSRIGKDMGFLT